MLISCHKFLIFRAERLRASAFSSSNSEHVRQLQQMGIEISVQSDGRLQLTHIPTMVFFKIFKRLTHFKFFFVW